MSDILSLGRVISKLPSPTHSLCVPCIEEAGGLGLALDQGISRMRECLPRGDGQESVAVLLTRVIDDSVPLAHFLPVPHQLKLLLTNWERRKSTWGRR